MRYILRCIEQSTFSTSQLSERHDVPPVMRFWIGWEQTFFSVWQTEPVLSATQTLEDLMPLFSNLSSTTVGIGWRATTLLCLPHVSFAVCHWYLLTRKRSEYIVLPYVSTLWTLSPDAPATNEKCVLYTAYLITQYSNSSYSFWLRL